MPLEVLHGSVGGGGRCHPGQALKLCSHGRAVPPRKVPRSLGPHLSAGTSWLAVAPARPATPMTDGEAAAVDRAC